jgi:hypothetical protein
LGEICFVIFIAIYLNTTKSFFNRFNLLLIEFSYKVIFQQIEPTIY